MSRDVRLFLNDILEAVQKIEGYKEESLETLLQTPMRADAITLNLLIIGEAAGKIPEPARASHPEVPWRQIVGLRNVIAHQYFHLDLEIIWDVIENELTTLKRAVTDMLDNLEP